MTGIGFRLVRCFYRDSDAASVDRFQYRGVLIFLSHAVVTAPAVFCNQASGSLVSFRRLPQRFGHGTRGVPLAISSGVWHQPAPDSDAQAHVSRALERLTMLTAVLSRPIVGFFTQFYGRTPMAEKSYDPSEVFAHAAKIPPRVFAAPQRYIQGAGVLENTGHYVKSLMRVNRAGILASKRGLSSQAAQVAESLTAQSIESVAAEFNGECSRLEIEMQSAALLEQQIDFLIAVGGGKVVDAGKCIAHRLEVPVVVVPTLASTDAPCSALSVVYTPEGSTDYVEFFRQNPEMVIVDTDVVASGSERFLVAGMGDAMATWFEARVCLNNPNARNMLGALPTLASYAIGQTCAHALFEHGEVAAESVRQNRNNESVDRIVEANTLLSGLGFESGGLALAHAVAVSFPAIEVVHDNYLHGEMVAMGTMIQLAMEQSDDAERVAKFFARVGLPIHFGQLSLALSQRGHIDRLIEATLQRAIAHHMPMPVNAESLRRAIDDAHRLGRAVAAEVGDERYRQLHK